MRVTGVTMNQIGAGPPPPHVPRTPHETMSNPPAPFVPISPRGSSGSRSREHLLLTPRGGFSNAFHGPPQGGGASRRRADGISWWPSSSGPTPPYAYRGAGPVARPVGCGVSLACRGGGGDFLSHPRIVSYPMYVQGCAPRARRSSCSTMSGATCSSPSTTSRAVST